MQRRRARSRSLSAGSSRVGCACYWFDGPPDGAQRSELEQALGVDGVERLSLGPLSLGALHAFLRNRLDRVFRARTLLRIHEQSGGNPFFALELARALGTDIDPTKPLPVPQTLEELVRIRLAGLPAATRVALGFVAALGTPSESLLARAGVDMDALDVAVDAHVLERENGRFASRTRCCRQCSMQTLGDGRRLVHRRIAEIVDDPLVRARHLARWRRRSRTAQWLRCSTRLRGRRRNAARARLRRSWQSRRCG